jgi:hypothetical protein
MTDNKFKNIYLTGGAYGMIYQLGALSRLRQEIKNNNSILYGCSAGALSCVLFLLYNDAFILDLYKSIAINVFNTLLFNPSEVNLTIQHFKTFEIIKRDHPTAYEKLNKKINIGVTTKDGFKWYNTFTSNNDLFNKLLCSFHVPFLCTYNAQLDGIKCIDGGFGIDVNKDLPKDCFVVCPKFHDPKQTKHSYMNGNIPILFCATPMPPILIDFYYNKGINDMITYKNTYKSHITPQNTKDENNIPIYLWWFLREFQPDDTKNVL